MTANEAVTLLRAEGEQAARIQWREHGSTPPTLLVVWNPATIAVAPLLDGIRLEDGVAEVVRTQQADAFVLLYCERTTVDEALTWAVFQVWGTREGERGGVLWPLQTSPLHGRTLGMPIAWPEGGEQLWAAGFPTLPPVVVAEDETPHT